MNNREPASTRYESSFRFASHSEILFPSLMTQGFADHHGGGGQLGRMSEVQGGGGHGNGWEMDGTWIRYPMDMG